MTGFYCHYACNKHLDMRHVLTTSSKCRRRVDIAECRCKCVCVCVRDNQTGLSCLSSGINSSMTHNKIAKQESFHATSGFTEYCQHSHEVSLQLMVAPQFHIHFWMKSSFTHLLVSWTISTIHVYKLSIKSCIVHWVVIG